MPFSFERSEDLRLRALAKHQILDTKAEATFDAITFAAKSILGVDTSLVCIVDADRQWFNASQGDAQGGQIQREHAFCAHAILDHKDIFEVPDASLDQRFANNPLVTGDPRIRFYAGVPLRDAGSDDLAFGALCLFDRQPRMLTVEQRAALRILGHGAEALMRERASHKQANVEIAQAYIQTPALLCLLDSTGAIAQVSQLWLTKFGFHESAIVGRYARDFMTPSSRRKFLAVRDLFWKQGGCVEYPCEFVTVSGEIVQVLMSANIQFDDRGDPQCVRCVLVDVTRQNQLQRDLEVISKTHQMAGLADSNA